MARLCSICGHANRQAIDDGLIAGQSLRDISGQYGLSKSAIDRHKGSHVSVPLAQDDADLAAEFHTARQSDHQQYQELRKNARATMRAFEGWQGIRTAEEWEQVCENAHKTYKSGAFIIKRLGAERFLDPETMAVLLQLHQDLIHQCGASSPAATMLIDLAVMTYYNALRVQGWIGDLSLVIEHELFGEESLRVKLGRQYGPQFDGFAVEEALRRLKEELIPLFERTNQQLVRNLQALQRPQRGVSPMVAVARAANVNVGQQQVKIERREARSSQPVAPR